MRALEKGTELKHKKKRLMDEFRKDREKKNAFDF